MNHLIKRKILKLLIYVAFGYGLNYLLPTVDQKRPVTLIAQLIEKSE
jgi:hypothetical protein